MPQEPLQLDDHSATLPNHDLHNHTIYCGHAEDDATVANLVARARELQIGCLGISEHLMFPDDAGFVSAVRDDLQAVSRHGIDVLWGVEMDVDTTDPNGGLVAPDFRCDYIILSAHGFPRFDLDIPDSEKRLPVDLQRRNLARKWLGWYRNAIANPAVHILGHPLREPINMGLITLQDVEIFEDVVQAFIPAIENGTAFELNNAFLNFLSDTPHFAGYVKLIKTLKARGMRFSRGSDSHGVAKVGLCDGIGRFADETGIANSDWFDPTPLLRR